MIGSRVVHLWFSLPYSNVGCLPLCAVPSRDDPAGPWFLHQTSDTDPAATASHYQCLQASSGKGGVITCLHHCHLAGNFLLFILNSCYFDLC